MYKLEIVMSLAVATIGGLFNGLFTGDDAGLGKSGAFDADAAGVLAVSTGGALSYVRLHDKLRNVGMELLKRVVYCSYESLSSECSVFCFIFIYSSFS